ncbi:MAG: DUF1150 family protein [Alphaproteobacteria bacterium]|jgi:hypothetical protein|nr:DUF1150 family protein [Alphaproteobacteria bacterium]
MTDNEIFADIAGNKPLVYVRQISPETLIAEGAMPEGAVLPEGVKLYALHLADGRRIAVMDDRQRAFAAALQNDLEPVSVH